MNKLTGHIRPAVIGLGYVGLPLALEISKLYSVIGFDNNNMRVDQLNHGFDRTKEVDRDELVEASSLTITNDEEQLKSCNLYIVTVPTPIDASKTPDLSPLIQASELVGKYLKETDIVVYESTVYPKNGGNLCPYSGKRICFEIK